MTGDNFRLAIDTALIASHRITGALIAAKAAHDEASPMARVAVSDVLAHGERFALAIKEAADLVQAAQPANDREGAHG